MALKAGTLTDFDNSMAQAMEEALAVLWQEKTGQPLGSAGEEDRRLMFVAIAQGVVKHLKDNAGAAFAVSVNVEQTGPWVSASGQTTSGHNHTVAVTQDNVVGNKVQSSGTGTVTLNTTGTLY
ncbi:MAG TPA: hypothetical protein ENJ19_06265 [Gammaproteobacteria bacterium]|nr:hypothetical protein [Gammaproteobacteria bacterium]